MSLRKRIKGDYLVESLDDDSYIAGPGDAEFNHPELHTVKFTTKEMVVDGNLKVTGTTTTVNSEETLIQDPTLTLNSGGDGQINPTGEAGIEVDRGIADSVGIRYRITGADGIWEAIDNTVDGWYPLAQSTAGFELVTDLTPQLGGDLDVNGFSITSEPGQDVVIDSQGDVILNNELSVEETLFDPSAVPGYNKLYAKLPGSGGTGLYVKSASIEDELVSRKKAIVFGLIF